jgi:hypothetical protein
MFGPRRPRKTYAHYRQTLPAGSNINRGNSSTLGFVSTFGGIWPGLGRRRGRKDLHFEGGGHQPGSWPRPGQAPAAAAAPPRPGRPCAPGPTKLLLEPTPPLSMLTPLPPAPAHRRAAKGSLTEQEKPWVARPTKPRDSYASGIRIPHSSPSAQGNSHSVKRFGQPTGES